MIERLLNAIITIIDNNGGDTADIVARQLIDAGKVEGYWTEYNWRDLEHFQSIVGNLWGIYILCKQDDYPQAKIVAQGTIAELP